MASLKVSIRDQCLLHYEGDRMIRQYPVSTAALGVGEQKGSYQTPRGRHRIRAKIGAGQPAGTVFQARRPVGLYKDLVADANADTDWVLTRILWLSGSEVGQNRLGDVDTMARYIYIHGTPYPVDGKPRSAGCIRMNNADVIELFDQIEVGDAVIIGDHDDKEIG